MSKRIKEIGYAFYGLFVAIVLLQVLAGCQDRLSTSRYDQCFKKPSRFEYVFFGYQLGCWLGDNQ